MMHRKGQALPFDPLIIPRVKQYLEENVHQTYVDVGVMARELQQRYREYYRRKAVPFRLLVEQAYRNVLHSYGLDSNPSSDVEEEATSDVEVMDDNGANSRNQMSTTLTSMYMNNRARGTSGQRDVPTDQAGAGADGEAIDISSDEEDGETAPTEERPAGGDISNYVQKFVAGNKHVTVTKLTRINKGRDDESSNGSVEDSLGNGAEKLVSNPKRRRLETGFITAMMNANGKVSRMAGGKSNKTDQYQSNAAGGGIGASGSGQRIKKFRKEIISKMVSTTFHDVGGMDRILKDLCELLLHVKHPEIYRHIGLPPPRGFLLHGPPGSGKTLLAQAIAGQLKVGLIEVPATELVAGVSGESEERIRDVFEQAASLAPCVLFIDEIDAISSNRINAQKDMERRIVAQLLSSLDALGKQDGGEGVIVIGATNRADALDPALRRVGRFDQEISLGIPDRAARTQILRIICRKLKIADTIDYSELGKLTPGYVGADLLALATRAANTAIKRLFTQREKKLFEIVPPNKTSAGDCSEDVVAIDDESDDVVNVDDEKEEPTKDGTKEITSTVAEESVDKVVESTVTVNEDTKPKEDNASKDALDITEETVAIPEKTQEKVPEPEKTNESQMDVDEVQVATAVTQPTDVPEISTEPPAVETVCQMEDDRSEIETACPVKPTVDAVHQTAPADNVEQLKLVPRPERMTLQRTLDLLLNQLNALPADELEGLCIEREDFLDSLRKVQPSAKREGFITVPDVTWNDIGSLGDIREELKLAILAPVKYPQRLQLLGLNAPSGVLLCGPPGCGKTLLAKAVANEAGINFISVKGPELLNMYVGESERAVRQCFQRARNSAPCVIFFDEFDALCPKRSETAEGSAGTRVVNQLLTEMDGIEERKGVFLMAATNRPDIVDPAVLRPGRLDKILYVGLPATDDRVEILRALTKNRTQPQLADDVELGRVAELTDGYTGADLAGLVRQASLQTLKDSILAYGGEEERIGDGTEVPLLDEDKLGLTVRLAHFIEAVRNIKPSVNAEDKKHYEKLRLKYGVSSTP